MSTGEKSKTGVVSLAKSMMMFSLTMLVVACSSAAEKSARQAMATEVSNVSEAKYRNVRKLDDKICGEVSMKDAIGNFTDYKKFAVISDGSVFFEGKFDPKIEKAFMGSCLD